MKDGRRKEFSGIFAEFLRDVDMSPAQWMELTGMSKVGLYKRLNNKTWTPTAEMKFLMDFYKRNHKAYAEAENAELRQKLVTMQDTMNRVSTTLKAMRFVLGGKSPGYSVGYDEGVKAFLEGLQKSPE